MIQANGFGISTPAPLLSSLVTLDMVTFRSQAHLSTVRDSWKWPYSVENIGWYILQSSLVSEPQPAFSEYRLKENFTFQS